MMMQGNNLGTFRKEASFAEAIRFSLGISKAKKCVEYPYWHLDTNSGSGWNEKSKCEGSPIAFIEEATRTHEKTHSSRRINLLCCDKNKKYCESLMEKIHQKMQIQKINLFHSVFNQDNSYFLSEMTKRCCISDLQ